MTEDTDPGRRERPFIRKDAARSVYCSGALFCPEEVSAMAGIAALLEDEGYSTFLPHRDGVEAFVLNSVNNPLANLLVFRPIVRFAGRATFAVDISRILDCDCLVFNMNGAVPDEGGVVETGVAYAAGRPVVIYREDGRDGYERSGSPLLAGACPGFARVSSIEAIPATLDDLFAAMDTGSTPPSAPGGGSRLAEIAAFGRKVDRLLRTLSFLKPTNMMSSR